jgi:15-cis-phytoene synthase
MKEQQVEEAYDYCYRVIRHASKTFYWGSLLFPLEKRRAIWAVYALFRMVDDLVDELDEQQVARQGHLTGTCDPRRALDAWRTAIQRLYKDGMHNGHPVLVAWEDLLSNYSAPLEPVLELMEGMEMDLVQNRYRSFEELYRYCYCVAGTVGVLTSSILGYQDPQALPYATRLGVAMQLTNILRDVGEDAQRGRIYLPLEEIERFGYSEQELLAGVINPAFIELMNFQIERANLYYEHARPGIALLNTDSHLSIAFSSQMYQAILQRIENNNYNVFTRRASVPWSEKLTMLGRCWWLVQRKQEYALPTSEILACRLEQPELQR